MVLVRKDMNVVRRMNMNRRASFHVDLMSFFFPDVMPRKVSAFFMFAVESYC